MHRPSLADSLVSPVIPVIVLDNAADAVPLARACAAGGLDLLEVTLRTAAGIESIRRIAAEVPEARVGAGTVTDPAEFALLRAAGARFAFSPGFDAALLSAADDEGMELVPGVMTPSDVMLARRAGLRHMKLFPAMVAGGIPMLDALAGPFPDVRFCPTGGVTPDNAAEFLARPNVFAVGGSWVVPRAAIAAGDWGRITELARAARALRT